MKTGTTRYGTSLPKVPAKHKDGSMLSIAFTVGMLFDSNQKANGVVAIIRECSVLPKSALSNSVYQALKTLSPSPI